MEKIIKIYSSGQAKLQKEALEIKLDIKDNKFNIPEDLLFTMSARENKKRAFLFVSRLIGKHIPIKPEVLKITGAILARQWVMDRYNKTYSDIDVLIEGLKELLKNDVFKRDESNELKSNIIKEAVKAANIKISLPKKTLFIGFAETATGLAQGVFNCFENGWYIHTTREIIDNSTPNFVFKEEHSHAVNHMIYAPTKEYFNNFEEIVLIDDEITTGNTARNLIKNLPGESFGVISILDWRDKDKYENNGQNIIFSSLTKGTVKCKKIDEVKGEELLKIKSYPNKHKDIKLKTPLYNENYIKYTGRFGLSYKESLDVEKQCKEHGAILNTYRTKERCLCVGEGEFIYLPCIISSYMGEDVYFQSSTKSPVFPLNKEGYGNKNKVEFNAPNGDKIKNYLYNLPHDFYEDVFFFSERELKEDTKTELANIFSTVGIKNITFVCFSEEGQI
ncbi:phosphoribosyltransferase family protein [Oceanirhabdus seepicola]|uniref:Phosphoribosyltransferase family protein n=1 Tax=Oceanirhabdus seepicola TaxID=2828781 RepID=A0A9J6NYR2_9CLOT|nr:phosphoribosyltransferase family protein [Oceanirhabdus seepicola]MCM1988288.1 phosphoribosyltransferase family protein [Oceanirhabdus seepicola]